MNEENDSFKENDDLENSDEEINGQEIYAVSSGAYRVSYSS